MVDLQETKALHHIAIVPTPGMGHLFPLIELAKQLSFQHKLAVTFIIPNDGSSMDLQKSLLKSLPSPISSLFLPPANLEDIPCDAPIETRMELTMTRSLPPLRDSLRAIKSKSTLSSIVVDIFGPSAFDVAQELGLLSFIFFPCNALVLSFFFHLPQLDKSTSLEYCELSEPIKLPGCVAVNGRDLFNPLHNRKSTTYKAFVQMVNRYKQASGIMVNSFMGLEPGPFQALKERVYQNPPIYPIGPLTQKFLDNDVSDCECLAWLDKQPFGSVMFVSFGSGGTLSSEQVTELAFGLEASGQRFLWALKTANDRSSEGAYFSLKSTKSPFDYLPNGFLERTKDVGLVVDSWAPQVQILAHGSTGGFLTHCGWNSTLESIANGMPLIAWPLYAEQRMNAVFLAEGLKVAMRVKEDERGIVGRQEIAKKVMELMEGEEGKNIRNKMEELKEIAKMALGYDGSSTQSLGDVAQIWKAHNNDGK